MIKNINLYVNRLSFILVDDDKDEKIQSTELPIAFFIISLNV